MCDLKNNKKKYIYCIKTREIHFFAFVSWCEFCNFSYSRIYGMYCDFNRFSVEFQRMDYDENAVWMGEYGALSMRGSLAQT